MTSVREPETNGARANGVHPAWAALTAPLVRRPEAAHLREVPTAKSTQEQDADDDLVRTVRMTSWMRRGFYIVVLLVALAGQVTGAVEKLHIPLIAAVPAVLALELGGVVVLQNADVRRRLGERARASLLLSVAIAAWAVAFNWLAHDNHLLGGFYAGMSALGYLVWLMHTGNQRRDRLRAKGDLPPTTPAYELWHWLRHPWITARAKSLAKANPRLGLYGSIEKAADEVAAERRRAAIARVLRAELKKSTDGPSAEIALAVYDLDAVARRLAAGADYQRLTEIVAARVQPDSLGVSRPSDAAPSGVVSHRRRWWQSSDRRPTAVGLPTPSVLELTAVPYPSVPVGPSDPAAVGRDPSVGVPSVPVGAVGGPSPVGPEHPSVDTPDGPSVTPVGDPRRYPSVKADRRPSVVPVGTRRSTPPTAVARRSNPSVPTPVESAAELRRRYPDGLPSDWAIRQATEWSPGRVKNARAAYDAGADLNPPNGDPS